MLLDIYLNSAILETRKLGQTHTFQNLTNNFQLSQDKIFTMYRFSYALKFSSKINMYSSRQFSKFTPH